MALLETLRRGGIKLGVISNGWTDFQQRTVDAIGICEALDVILISQAEEIRKPDVRIFQRGAARLGVRPAECIFVGDNPVADVLGAEAAGMRSVWLRRGMEWPGGHPSTAICIDDLLDVVELASEQTQPT